MNNADLRHNVWRRFFAAAAIALPALSVSADAYFGYAPLEADPAIITAQGSGQNGYAEAVIALDPASNPVGAILKGKKIKGVRCYVRADYPQKNKRTSGINVHYGALGSSPEKFYANLMAGWNDVMFDQPIEIGDEALYIGPMVYETSGTPYPFVSAAGGAIPGGYSISLKKSDWQHLGERGNLLCHLIIDAEPSEMPLAAQVAPTDLPLVVAPDSRFGCRLTVHNYSGQEVSDVEISVGTDGGATVYTEHIVLDEPLAAFDTRTVDAYLPTGKNEDPAMAYTISVTALDGEATVAAPATPYTLHVTKDAFLRIPLVEEFTSQLCTNCPFMAYYLDMAMEELGGPLVYISRHTGFVDDYFTHPFDKELVYLFGSSATYNPAVMYDRTVRAESDPCPVYGAKLSSTVPYTEALMDVSSRPALAKILVDSDVKDGKVTCRVYGRVADGISLDNLRLNASFIESGLSIDKWFQTGIADAPEDAPDDLAEKFHHNGIVRVAFNKEALGDVLEVDPVTREFDVTYEAAAIDPIWELDHCEAVAFICRVDKDNLRENYVLNAGGTRWNALVGGSDGICDVIASANDVRAYIGADGKVRVDGEYLTYNVYTIYGQSIAAGAPLSRGVYIVDVITSNGHKAIKLRY